ncbi:peptidase C60 sortase A and B [Xylanimonas cellulosilytica DSM 15894]|uniref:Peptidase C60 sortase A and B n=1 Tax=Xylanimonas cellulosilytica (strain DSM 15894 / JCM 12276 / CECT 5975 / KCTC 9989 / LMG 20990 / NBRC 107835 / XIL07) TaxID=446471 RepID=D1BTB4_XYLCX|nr:class E sortase [Xylanimonas cellulosilytica]ACZ29056.1 peptidase C60 sortase A and B [Xylanimonas cellulosilytica DSM 15894]
MSAAAVPAHARVRVPRHSAGSVAAGVFGELLITVGVLLGLFVVWQLWWTDVVAVREQHQVLQALDWEAPPPAPEAPAGVEPAAPVERRDPPPVDEEPAFAEVFAQLYIPRFGSDYVAPVAEGIDRQQVLDVLGVGHYPGTAMPGELGNFATAGHRTTFGRPYHLVADLVEGDPVVVRTAATWYVYRVVSHEIVMPWQTEVISPVPGLRAGDPIPELTQRLMTMTACHPMFSARERYIVHAELDFWMPVSAGVPAVLTDAGVDVVGVEGGD